MNGELLAFFILALIAIAGGVLMLSLKKVIHMVVALVFTFLSIAGIYVLLSAEFVAVVQVLIYSGAISIIMLFGIMLTRHRDSTKAKGGRLRYACVTLAVLAFFATMFYGVRDLVLGEPATALHEGNAEQVGMSLYAEYVIPFEMTSVLLLVALIGAIVLAKRDDEEELSRDE